MRTVSALVLVALASMGLPEAALSQTAQEQVRVRTRHANIQAGATSGADVLVLVPRGTVLTVLKRQKPWVLVELTPKIREAGTPMRWFKNENRGYLHDSAVEPVK